MTTETFVELWIWDIFSNSEDGNAFYYYSTCYMKFYYVIEISLIMKYNSESLLCDLQS